jgi:hypothetical protein
MMGLCGRNGKPGLAVLFMEPKRRFGINKIEAVTKADKQMDDTRMDCLAITPMCLRIAFSMDNLYVNIHLALLAMRLLMYCLSLDTATFQPIVTTLIT